MIVDATAMSSRPARSKLGDLQGGSWVVLDGLKAGDRVIVDGLQKIQPGSPVRIAQPTSQPPARGQPKRLRTAER